jgi:hypothetical protein
MSYKVTTYEVPHDPEWYTSGNKTPEVGSNDAAVWKAQFQQSRDLNDRYITRIHQLQAELAALREENDEWRTIYHELEEKYSFLNAAALREPKPEEPVSQPVCAECGGNGWVKDDHGDIVFKVKCLRCDGTGIQPEDAEKRKAFGDYIPDDMTPIDEAWWHIGRSMVNEWTTEQRMLAASIYANISIAESLAKLASCVSDHDATFHSLRVQG